MKKVLISIIIIFVIIIGLTVTECSNRNSDSSPDSEVIETVEPTIVATPEPTPEVVSINGKSVSVDELKSGYTFDLFGQSVNTKDTTELHYIREPISDADLDTFREVLPYMYGLNYLTFDRCETSDEAVASLREEFKDDVKIAWRVFFTPFSCMTDTEKIWASCDLRDENTDALKYCNDVKYLDIGHNALHSLWFLEYMPNLEVLIISCSEFEDISEVAYCKKLVFLECAETWARDLTPIAELKDTLEYLNIGSNPNMPPDLSMFDCMTKLKRFYCQMFFNYNIDMSAEQERFEKLFPDCEVNFDWSGVNTAIMTKWRFTRDGAQQGHFNVMYLKIREIFEYDNPWGSTRLYNDDSIDLDYSNRVIDLDFGDNSDVFQKRYQNY